MAWDGKPKKVKRILLIEPPKTGPAKSMKRTRPAVQPPLGLAYIAAMLEKNDYEVKILDAIIEDPLCHKGTYIDPETIRFGITGDKIEKYIKDFAPDIVGISCAISAKYNDAKNVCMLAMRAAPDCVTVMGGVHATIRTQDVLEDENLDFAVQGEGEYSFLDLIRYIEGKLSLSDLDGIGMKVDGVIKIIPKTKFIGNLDELPFPARHLLPFERYSDVNLPHGEATRQPWATIYTSRGCPAACIYCSARLVFGRKFRARSANNVLEEIGILVSRYDVKELLIEDDNFSCNKERTRKILDGIINSGWDLTWTTPSGMAVFALDEDLLKRIKASGCASITFGIESGSQRVLDKVVKKPLSLKKVEEVAKAAKSMGLKTKGFFMLGIPGESKEEMEQTLDMARQLKLDWSCFSVTQPLPGTELYDICVDRKYIKGKFDPCNVEYMTGRINTPDFDENYVNKMWDKANNINFLENPNLMDDGNVDQAIADFKRVIRMVSNHELAHLSLGDAYAKKTMFKEAVAEWKTVLSINNANEMAKKRLEGCADNG